MRFIYKLDLHFPIYINFHLFFFNIFWLLISTDSTKSMKYKANQSDPTPFDRMDLAITVFFFNGIAHNIEHSLRQ